MAYFNSQGKKVYYETHGVGAPLLLLNGIMMSTLSWKLFLNSFPNNQLILVDFFDQGFSEKLEDVEYKQDIQLEIVKDLLDELKIEKVNLVGISYGGEVAIQFALKYQERIAKLLLFNTTASTTPWIEDIGRGWIEVAKTYNPTAFYKVTIPIIYSPEFYNTNLAWMKKREEILSGVFQKPFLDAIIRLIKSAEGYNVRDLIYNINVPTLIVGAENDYLTPLDEQRYLNNQIITSELVILSRCGHASMYEKPGLFISLVDGFVNSDIRLSVI